MDVSGETRYGRIFPNPFTAVESVGKFSGDGTGSKRRLQRALFKAGSWGKGSLFSFRFLGSNPHGSAQLQRQTQCRAQNTLSTTLQKGNPGACQGLASDPSVGPRVNRNHQMEHKLHKGKLFFQRGKRLPFRDLW